MSDLRLERLERRLAHLMDVDGWPRPRRGAPREEDPRQCGRMVRVASSEPTEAAAAARLRADYISRVRAGNLAQDCERTERIERHLAGAHDPVLAVLAARGVPVAEALGDHELVTGVWEGAVGRALQDDAWLGSRDAIAVLVEIFGAMPAASLRAAQAALFARFDGPEEAFPGRLKRLRTAWITESLGPARAAYLRGVPPERHPESVVGWVARWLDGPDAAVFDELPSGWDRRESHVVIRLGPGRWTIPPEQLPPTDPAFSIRDLAGLARGSHPPAPPTEPPSGEPPPDVAELVRAAGAWGHHVLPNVPALVHVVRRSVLGETHLAPPPEPDPRPELDAFVAALDASTWERVTDRMLRGPETLRLEADRALDLQAPSPPRLLRDASAALAVGLRAGAPADVVAARVLAQGDAAAADDWARLFYTFYQWQLVTSLLAPPRRPIEREDFRTLVHRWLTTPAAGWLFRYEGERGVATERHRAAFGRKDRFTFRLRGEARDAEERALRRAVAYASDADAVLVLVARGFPGHERLVHALNRRLERDVGVVGTLHHLLWTTRPEPGVEEDVALGRLRDRVENVEAVLWCLCEIDEVVASLQLRDGRGARPDDEYRARCARRVERWKRKGAWGRDAVWAGEARDLSWLFAELDPERR